MLRFTYLTKQEKEYWLPELFDLLYENMKSIAPSGLSYEEEKRLWLEAVSPALEKAPRQILLCFAQEELAGFAQFYTRENLLMVEEVQVAKTYHRSFLFYRLCRFLLEALPPEITVVEPTRKSGISTLCGSCRNWAWRLWGRKAPFSTCGAMLRASRKNL